MKKLYFSFLAVLFLFSCKKDEVVKTEDFSLLYQYNWKSITAREASIITDKGREIMKYADTAMYSFAKSTFSYYAQNSVYGSLMGSGMPVWMVSYSKSSREGEFKLNTRDSTFQITFKGYEYHGSPWEIKKPVEKTFTMKYKIISLDRNVLKISTNPPKAGVSCITCYEETYYPVSK